MSNTINIPFPVNLANQLNLNHHDFKIEIQRLSIIKLYEIGEISSSNAAKILGIKKVEFLDLISKYNVSYIDQNIDLLTDLNNA